MIRPADLITIGRERVGWHGVPAFRAAVALARPGVASPMETIVRLTVVAGGLPEPKVQHTVYDSDGHFMARLDLAYEEERVGLEYDGDHHRARATFRRDATRANRLSLCRWTILRFTANDVLHHRPRLLSQVRAAIRVGAVQEEVYQVFHGHFGGGGEAASAGE